MSLLSLSSAELRLRLRWRLGLLLLGFVVVLWVLSSFLVDALYDKHGYLKPYLITYLNTSTFTFYLVPSLIRAFKKPRLYSGEASNGRAYLSGNFGPSKDDSQNNDYNSENDDEDINEDSRMVESFMSESPAVQKISTKETAKLSVQFCILWFVANWFANGCLAYTSVGSATVLTCTSGLFTLFLGSLCGVEKYTNAKLLAALVSILGIVLVSGNDTSAGKSNGNDGQEADSNAAMSSSARALLGDAMALASAFCYGLYTTLLKYKVRDESRMDMQKFFGLVGFFNVILLWPLLLILNATGAEKLELPSDNGAWTLLLLNAASTFIADFMWVIAMLLTSPLVVTIGLGATIPLAMAADFYLKGSQASFFYYLGAVFVGGSFVVVTYAEENEAEKAVKEPQITDSVTSSTMSSPDLGQLRRRSGSDQ